MDEYRLLNKKLSKSSNKNNKKKSKLITLVNTFMFTGLLFIINLILCKTNLSYKDWIYKNVYSKNFSFAKIEEIYKKYFGNIVPSKKSEEKTLAVSGEKNEYKNVEEKDDGVLITLDESNKQVYAYESGVVVFSGIKDEFGNTIIVEQVDGTEAWYINLDISNIKIYDYIEKGSIISNSLDNTYKMIFKDEGNTIDYKKYIY